MKIQDLKLCMELKILTGKEYEHEKARRKEQKKMKMLALQTSRSKIGIFASRSKLGLLATGRTHSTASINTSSCYSSSVSKKGDTTSPAKLVGDQRRTQSAGELQTFLNSDICPKDKGTIEKGGQQIHDVELPQLKHSRFIE